MSDLIERQAAIEALARMMPRSYTPDGSHPADEEIFRAQEVIADCIEALEILQPAQPEINCSEIPNSSTDCISRQADRLLIGKDGILMSDLISRQAAIDALENTKEVAR